MKYSLTSFIISGDRPIQRKKERNKQNEINVLLEISEDLQNKT